MNESMAWTVGLGRWLGVRVRVHALLVAFAVSLLWWGVAGELGAKAYGPLFVAVLGASVLGREIARLGAARWGAGGSVSREANEIVLWPMGGWLSGETLDSRRGELAVAVAPPLASGVLMATGAATLAVMMAGSGVSQTTELGSLVSILPPSPTMLEGGVIGSSDVSVSAAIATAAALLAWVNGVLLVINLLPVGSLDAGHVLRAALRNDPNPARRERIMSRVAVATAVALGGLGFGVWGVQPGASLMLWLVALGMYRRAPVQEWPASRAEGCLVGVAALEVELRRCRQSRAFAGGCRPLSRVCIGPVAEDVCFDLPQGHNLARYDTAGEAASTVASLLRKTRSWAWGGIASIERSRFFRSRRRRS